MFPSKKISKSTRLYNHILFYRFIYGEGKNYEQVEICRGDILKFVINNEENIDTLYFIPVYRFEFECISHLRHVKTINLETETSRKLNLKIDTSNIETIIINNSISLHPDLDIKNIKRVVVKLIGSMSNIISYNDGFYVIGKVKLPTERYIELDLSNLFCVSKTKYKKCRNILNDIITHSIPVSKIIYNNGKANAGYFRIDYFLVEYKRRINPDVEYDIQGLHLFPMYNHQVNLRYIKNVGSKLFLNLPKIIVFSIFKVIKDKTKYNDPAL